MASVFRWLRGKRRLPWLALGVVVLLLGGGSAVLLFARGGDVVNRNVEFADTTDQPNTLARTGGKHPADDHFTWPVFGYSKGRTQHLALRVTPRPPWQEAWSFRGGVLLEFPPVLCGRSLFLLKNNGTLYALSRATGQVRWKRRLGKLAASSPACGHGAVYAVLLSRRNKRKAGLVARVSAKTGRTRWSRNLPSRAESSPLLDRGLLFFGTENGTVYSLRAHDGKVHWRAKAAGAVKGAIALDAGKLYLGDYGGKVNAIRRKDGKRVWRASASSGGLGIGDSNLYSGAAVQYGRVYIGSTNGNVYSFSSASGKLAWRKHTGDYVYASPAVGRVEGGQPTVYIGSYDGRFYALDARSGRVRWKRSMGKKFSGGASIIGNLVWVSDVDKRTTWALNARSGATVYKTRRGAFHPVISDGRRVYFSGYSSLFALDPKAHPFDPRASSIRAQRARTQKSAERRAARRHQRYLRRVKARHRHFRHVMHRRHQRFARAQQRRHQHFRHVMHRRHQRFLRAKHRRHERYLRDLRRRHQRGRARR